uniref:Uncharacterized protein n=1 Tax=Anopheles merus TaxID=30066 RepID=A0A182VIL2_ANOME
MIDFTTLVVALYTISFVRSSGIVLVGSTFFTANFSSPDCGVVQRSIEELFDLIIPPPPPPPPDPVVNLLLERFLLLGGGRHRAAIVLERHIALQAAHRRPGAGQQDVLVALQAATLPAPLLPPTVPAVAIWAPRSKLAERTPCPTPGYRSDWFPPLYWRVSELERIAFTEFPYSMLIWRVRSSELMRAAYADTMF